MRFKQSRRLKREGDVCCYFTTAIATIIAIAAASTAFPSAIASAFPFAVASAAAAVLGGMRSFQC